MSTHTCYSDVITDIERAQSPHRHPGINISLDFLFMSGTHSPYTLQQYSIPSPCDIRAPNLTCPTFEREPDCSQVPWQILYQLIRGDERGIRH